MTSPEFWRLYHQMVRSRKFEELVEEFWEAGYISGEMHMGIGEEAINVGVVSQLLDGDALALDHRGTSAALLRGIDPTKLLLEFMGNEEGLCRGQGGHMHLFNKEHFLASSGIVGASAPTAVGFAMKIDYVGSDNIAVAFFGEGAINEGVVLESLNLAAIWELPVLFVCKDNDLSITTISSSVTAGSILDRVSSFGIKNLEIDGTDLLTVWNTVNTAIEYIRQNRRPFFILATCEHKTGHFLGDPLVKPIDKEMLVPLVKASLRRKGSSPLRRIINLLGFLKLSRKGVRQGKDKAYPYVKEEKGVTNKEKIAQINDEVDKEMVNLRNKVMEIQFGGDQHKNHEL